jgi:Leucine-rich repeat (LRR) protein
LDEALKDPESVLVLKYMYREQLSKRESDQIAQLHNLEILYLPSMGLQRLPQCVVALPNLKELDLDYNRITSLAGLASLSNLQLLSLRSNGSLTDEMCREISALVSLRELRVGECGMTDIPVSWQRLHLLETIFLFGNPIAAVPEWLPALPHLKRLGLVEVMDDRKKDQLRERYPHLEIW